MAILKKYFLYKYGNNQLKKQDNYYLEDLKIKKYDIYRKATQKISIEDEFVFRFDENDESLCVQLRSDQFLGVFEILWGDEELQEGETEPTPIVVDSDYYYYDTLLTHTYSQIGEYVVKIKCIEMYEDDSVSSDNGEDTWCRIFPQGRENLIKINKLNSYRKYMNHTFYECSNLEELNADIPMFCKIFQGTFCKCSNLKIINCPHLFMIPKNVTDASESFRECKSLPILPIINYELTKLETLASCFKGASGKIQKDGMLIPENVDCAYMFANFCEELELDGNYGFYSEFNKHYSRNISLFEKMFRSSKVVLKNLDFFFKKREMTTVFGNDSRYIHIRKMENVNITVVDAIDGSDDYITMIPRLASVEEIIGCNFFCQPYVRDVYHHYQDDSSMIVMLGSPCGHTLKLVENCNFYLLDQVDTKGDLQYSWMVLHDTLKRDGAYEENRTDAILRNCTFEFRNSFLLNYGKNSPFREIYDIRVICRDNKSLDDFLTSTKCEINAKNAVVIDGFFTNVYSIAGCFENLDELEEVRNFSFYGTVRFDDCFVFCGKLTTTIPRLTHTPYPWVLTDKGSVCTTSSECFYSMDDMYWKCGNLTTIEPSFYEMLEDFAQIEYTVLKRHIEGKDLRDVRFDHLINYMTAGVVDECEKITSPTTYDELPSWMRYSIYGEKNYIIKYLELFEGQAGD